MCSQQLVIHVLSVSHPGDEAEISESMVYVDGGVALVSLTGVTIT